MRFEDVGVDGAYVVHLDPRRDERGSFARLYCVDELAGAGADLVPVQANLGSSVEAGTLRGLHFQVAPHQEAKLVHCVAGSIFDAIVDLRRASPTFGKAASVTLSAEGPDADRAFFIPAGCAHGYMTLEPETKVLYFVSARYTPDADRGLAWDDPALAIPWPREPAVMVDRDRRNPKLSELDPAWLS